ncbi:unnamed protein product [Amoebophrya sp. A25]|nr:unnamed protein product [Amoebophrya sp. A25]|eukprot:GSA25T00005084001.1
MALVEDVRCVNCGESLDESIFGALYRGYPCCQRCWARLEKLAERNQAAEKAGIITASSGTAGSSLHPILDVIPPGVPKLILTTAAVGVCSKLALRSGKSLLRSGVAGGGQALENFLDMAKSAGLRPPHLDTIEEIKAHPVDAVQDAYVNSQRTDEFQPPWSPYYTAPGVPGNNPLYPFANNLPEDVMQQMASGAALQNNTTGANYYPPTGDEEALGDLGKNEMDPNAEIDERMLERMANSSGFDVNAAPIEGSSSAPGSPLANIPTGPGDGAIPGNGAASSLFTPVSLGSRLVNWLSGMAGIESSNVPKGFVRGPNGAVIPAMPPDLPHNANPGRAFNYAEAGAKLAAQANASAAYLAFPPRGGPSARRLWSIDFPLGLGRVEFGQTPGEMAGHFVIGPVYHAVKAALDTAADFLGPQEGEAEGTAEARNLFLDSRARSNVASAAAILNEAGGLGELAKDIAAAA